MLQVIGNICFFNFVLAHITSEHAQMRSVTIAGLGIKSDTILSNIFAQVVKLSIDEGQMEQPEILKRDAPIIDPQMFNMLMRLCERYKNAARNELYFRLIDVHNAGRLSMNQFVQVVAIFTAPLEPKAGSVTDCGGLLNPRLACICRGLPTVISEMSHEQRKAALSKLTEEELIKELDLMFPQQKALALHALGGKMTTSCGKGSLAVWKKMTMAERAGMIQYLPAETKTKALAQMTSDERRLLKQQVKVELRSQFAKGLYSSLANERPKVMLVILLMTNFTVLLEPFAEPHFPTQAEVQDFKCSDKRTIFWMVMIAVYTIETLAEFLSFCHADRYWWFVWPFATVINPVDQKLERKFQIQVHHYMSVLDLTQLACLIMAVTNVCNSSSVYTNWVLVLAPGRCFKCTFLLLHFREVRRVFVAAIMCVRTIGIHLAVFAMIYFAFMCLCCAIFAGCVTEVTANGGPGDWSTSPWNSTDFGSASFYYDLNFDHAYTSFYTLFALMVQNNWQVTVDGYSHCDFVFQKGARSVRYFFILFNILTVWVLLNILTSVMMETYSFYYHLDDNMDQMITGRVHQQKSRSKKQGGIIWRLNPLKVQSSYAETQGFRTDSCLSMQERLAAEQNTLGVTMIMEAPIPIYGQTIENKIIFCNHEFASLYGEGTQNKDLEGLHRISNDVGQDEVLADYEHMSDCDGNVFRWDAQVDAFVPETEALLFNPGGMESKENTGNWFKGQSPHSDVRTRSNSCKAKSAVMSSNKVQDSNYLKSLSRDLSTPTQETCLQATISLSSKRGSVQVYTERGQTQNGTKLVFKCKESPLVGGAFESMGLGQGTIVYMFPHGNQNQVPNNENDNNDTFMRTSRW